MNSRCVTLENSPSPFNNGAGTTAAANLFKNPDPKTDNPANGRSETPVKAFPLIVFNSSPCTTAINLSVVGFPRQIVIVQLNRKSESKGDKGTDAKYFNRNDKRKTPRSEDSATS